MEGDMDMDVFNTAHDNEGFEGDEETSFIDVDEDFYDNFSRAVASDTLENYDWGSQERYEAARSKYIREHGASNIPSWMDLSDQLLSPLYYEDPLTTIKGAQERIIELYPNTNLDEIRLSKKDGKIHIRLLNQKTGKWTVEEPLFTKDGEIRVKVQSYEGFKEATRNRLQELEELNRRLAAKRELEDLSEELFVANEKIIQLQMEKVNAVEAQRQERTLLNSKIVEMEVELHNRNLDIQKLQRELAGVKTDIKVLEKSKERLSNEGQDKYQMLEEKAAKLSKKLEDAEKEAAEYEKEKMEALRKEAETSEKVDSIEKEKASLLNERNTLSEDLFTLIKTHKEEESTSNRLRDEIKRDREQYDKLSLRVKDLEDEVENKNALLETMQKMKENAEKIISQQENPTKEQLEELREYREKEDIIKEESERITKELTETRKEYGKILEEIKKANSESLKEHEAQIESLKKELKEKDEELQKTQKTLNDLYKQQDKEKEALNHFKELMKEVLDAKEKIKDLNNEVIELKSIKDAGLQELEELKEVIKENDREYMKQNKLLLDDHKKEKAMDVLRIIDLQKENKNIKGERDIARRASERDINSENEKRKKLNLLLKENEQLKKDLNSREDEIHRIDDKIKELTTELEKQREFFKDNSKTEEEIEAQREKLEGIQERIAEMESRKENLERVLGLTRREKILRYLKRAGWE